MGSPPQEKARNQPLAYILRCCSVSREVWLGHAAHGKFISRSVSSSAYPRRPRAMRRTRAGDRWPLEYFPTQSLIHEHGKVTSPVPEEAALVRVRRLALVAVTAVLGGSLSAGLCAAQTLNRNDPAAVLRAVRAALGPDAQLVERSAGCITTPPHFPDLVIVRVAIPDAGCQLLGVLNHGSLERGEEHGGLLERIGQEALIARGWRAANGEARRVMAEEWVTEVLFTDDAV